METPIETQKRRDGYNTKRLREILGVKQEDLADMLGLSQQAVSKLEQKEVIDDATLEKIAQALSIPIDAIKNFSEDVAVNFVANTFHDSTVANTYHQCTFNTIDKIVELFERLLKAEQEKVQLLQEVLNKK